MNHLTRQALSAALAIPVASALIAACSGDFDSCEAQRTCAPNDGASSGGSSSDAGHSAGGSGASAGAGGDAMGGDSNRGGSGGAGGSDEGSGGSAGSSGGSDGVAGAGATSSGGGVDGSSSGGSDNEGGSDAVAGGGGFGGFGGEGGGIAEPHCGDATVDAGEACDDGNRNPADGCRPNCTWGPKQVVVGAHSSCALFGNGAAKCWGSNAYRVLAQGDENHRGDQAGEMGTALPFIHVGNSVGAFSALSMNAMMACGVVKQALWCWGHHSEGQLGQGHATDTVSAPVAVDLGGPVASVSVGYLFACGLLTDGSVKCWGHGLYGKLGIGHEWNVGDQPNQMGKNLKSVQFGEPATQISTKDEHTCALLKSGKVACWGHGGARLGQGTTGAGLSYGDTADELTPPEVPLGGGAAATSIGVGSSHSCAILGGSLKCWGGNTTGKLGLGLDPNDDAADAMGDTPDELGTGLSIVPITPTLGTDPVIAVHPGVNHTCALLRSGGVKCWGASTLGRLAQPTLAPLLGNIGDAPGELSSLPVIDFGAGTTVRSLGTGISHACALLSTGDVKCWGVNQLGQLGLGHTTPIGTLASDLGAAMKAVQLE